MTDELRFDRSLAAWFESDQLPNPREAVVDAALTEARAARQRGWIGLALRGPESWPPRGVVVPAVGRIHWVPLVPAMRSLSLMLIIVLLLALLLVAFAGSLLQPRPTWPPFGSNGVIAYSISDPDGPARNTQLRLIDPDGSNDRNLAQGTGPVFSVDGSALMYANGFGFGEENLRLVLAKPDGSEPREVAIYQQTGFALSPDGSQIATRIAHGPREVEPGISLVDLSDGLSRQLLPAPPSGERYWELYWAPDGSQLSFSTLRELTTSDNSASYRPRLEIVDVATGETRVVTSRSGTDSPTTAWSPDSQWLAYTGTLDGSPDPAFGPEGETDSLYPPQGIFLIRADGSQEVRLPGSAGFIDNLRWAPDLSAISYVGFDELSETRRLFVQPLIGYEANGAPLPGPAAEFAEWSPDAEGLLFLALGDFGSRLSIVDRDLAEQPSVLVDTEQMIGLFSWQRLDP